MRHAVSPDLRSLKLGSARAARVAAAVALMAIAPLLLGYVCGDYDDIPEPPSNWVETKGHPGPAWGRTDGGTVIVFGWNEGLPVRGGTLYMIREDGTGLTRLSESVGDYTYTGNGIAYDSSPAISPDGTRLVYATERYLGRFDIATTTLEEQERVLFFFGGGREHQPLTSGQASQAAPAWSPDGTRIAFLKSSVLHTMAADGSDVRSIAPGIRAAVWQPPAWSPDGTRLAFHGSERDWRELSLYVVDADGSNLTLVAERVAEAVGRISRPTWSPDGRYVAFVAPEGQQALRLLDADSGTVRALVQGGFGPLLWSPDGTEIFYGSYGRSDNQGNTISEQGLFATTVSGGAGIRRVTELSTNVIAGMARSWDGARIAVLMRPFSYADALSIDPYADVVLYTVALDGSDPQALVRVGIDGELVAQGESTR